MQYHFFDEAPNDMHSRPVPSVNDDISFAAVMGKLFGIVIDNISLFDRWSKNSYQIYILDARASSLVSSTLRSNY